MSEQVEQVRVTGTDIANAGEKLKQFQETLPEGERAVIGRLVQRAAEAPVEGEVSGYLSQYAGQLQASTTYAVNPAFRGLGLSQFARTNPGQLADIGFIISVKF